MDTDVPLPTHFKRPILNASFPAMFARQVADEDFGAVALIKSEEGKYLAFKTRAHNVSGSCKIPRLALRAWLG